MHLPQHCYYAKVLHKALFPTLNSMKQKTENAKCAFKVRTPPVTLKHQIFFLSFFITVMWTFSTHFQAKPINLHKLRCGFCTQI